MTIDKKKTRLGVNIDHVATLRQVRGESYPSIVQAATICLENGADQITIHLREDRRHIQDTDVEAVRLVTRRFGRPLNLEIGCNPEIVEIAIASSPDWICLVPENRQEKTTEGGLNLLSNETFQKVEQTLVSLNKHVPKTKISLFLEADVEILEKACSLSKLFQAVEIHTGDYARDFLNGNDVNKHLEKFRKSKQVLDKYEVATHAGHGLTVDSLKPLVEEGLFEEFNIGHWIICQAVYDGLAKVIKDLVQVLNQDQGK